MAWKDTRTTTRTVVANARTVAHADDAKSRAHEASSLTGRGFPTKLIAGGAAVGLAVVGFVAFRSREDDQRDKAALATAAAPSASSSPADQEPSPAEVLAESQPGGAWRAQTFGRSLVTEGAPRTADLPTSPSVDVLRRPRVPQSQCRGAMSSAAGNNFDYLWNGRTLKVTAPESSWKDYPKAASSTASRVSRCRCGESAVSLVVPPADGALVPCCAAKMTGPLVTTVHYKFFGTCDPGTMAHEVVAGRKLVISRAE